MKKNISILPAILVTWYLLSANTCAAQGKNHEPLKAKLRELTASFKATIGISAIHLETGDTFVMNGSVKYPMQSVYKFPLAMAVLHEVDKGNLSLSQHVHVVKEDLPGNTWSPMQKKYPQGNVEVSIADLLYYSVSLSDNNACDLLFKLMKGTTPVNQYVHSLGITGIDITSTEREMHDNFDLQYKNYCKPFSMSALLKGLYEKKYLSDSSNKLLMHLMTETQNSPNRLKGMLPYGTPIAHKTGTGANSDSFINACNDAGIITMPDGSHLILTVFVMDATATYEACENIIAKISKEIFDFYNGKPTVFFERHLFVSKSNDTLLYRLLPPKNENKKMKYPLLVYLHGSGLRGNDNERPVSKLNGAFTDSLNRINYPCYILVPQCPGIDSWAWFPHFPKSLHGTDTAATPARLTLELIHQLMNERNIDTGRIYLTGFSLGGEGTFDLLIREPGLFACAVPIASVADTSKAGLLKNIPIWAFHGTADQVTELKYSRMMAEAIQRAGGNPKLTEVYGAKHNCQQEAYTNPELWKWMFAQRKPVVKK